MSITGVSQPASRKARNRDRSSASAAWLLPAVIAFIATAWKFNTKPLWRDEIWTLATSIRPWGAMFHHLAVDDAGLSGYYSLAHLWLSVDQSSSWLRLPGGIAAIVGPALLGVLGRRIAGTMAGIAAGSLLTLMPVVIEHTQEARPYPLVVAALCATALLIHRYVEQPNRRALIGWSACAALTVLLHPLPGLPGVAALALAALAQPGEAKRSRVIAGIAPAATIGLIIVLVGSRQVSGEVGGAGLHDLLRLRHNYGGNPIAILIVAALAVIGAISLRRQARSLALVLTWAVLPTLVLWIYGVVGSLFQARYTIASAPAVALLAGIGVAALCSVAQPRLRPAVASAVIAVALLSQVPAFLSFRDAPFYVDDPVGAAAMIANQAKPGDGIVYIGTTARPMFDRYLPAATRLNDVLLVKPAPAGKELEGVEAPTVSLASAVESPGRIWLVGTLTGAVWTPGAHPARVEAVEDAVEEHRTRLDHHDFGRVRVELWAPDGG